MVDGRRGRWKNSVHLIPTLNSMEGTRCLIIQGLLLFWNIHYSLTKMHAHCSVSDFITNISCCSFCTWHLHRVSNQYSFELCGIGFSKIYEIFMINSMTHIGLGLSCLFTSNPIWDFRLNVSKSFHWESSMCMHLIILSLKIYFMSKLNAKAAAERVENITLLFL